MVAVAEPTLVHEEHHARRHQSLIGKYLFSTDHKQVGINYMVTAFIFFIIGGILAELMRVNLVQPGSTFVDATTYNELYTMHGTTMIFLFAIPMLVGGFTNFAMPLMIGAPDVAFPRLNMLSYVLFPPGGVLLMLSFLYGAPQAGWTSYPPVSLQGPIGQTFWCLSIIILGASSTLSAINFLVTIINMRCRGLRLTRLPLFVWAVLATSAMVLVATPALAGGVGVLLLARVFGVPFFDPAKGGNVILWQHMFWFYSHPAVYIMILPGFGVISEIIPCFSRKRIFGYSAIAFSSIAIAVFGFLVWAHHMFIAGVSTYSALIFSFVTFLVAIPSAIKVFNWTATLYKGSIRFDTPMLYALAFIGLFTIGGLTGLFLGAIGVDMHVTATYFVVAHFHYVMVGGMLVAYLAGMHFWWPKMTGRMYPEAPAKLSALIVFIGFNLTFFPQFILGYMGMPRRYHSYPPEFQVLNVLSTAGASVLAVGLLMPMFYMLWSLKYGEIAGNNPYRATGLEWQTTSPPPTHNFHETPIVTQEAYDYESQTEEVEVVG